MKLLRGREQEESFEDCAFSDILIFAERHGSGCREFTASTTPIFHCKWKNLVNNQVTMAGTLQPSDTFWDKRKDGSAVCCSKCFLALVTIFDINSD